MPQRNPEGAEHEACSECEEDGVQGRGVSGVERRLDVHHGRQMVEVGLDQLERVLGDVATVGDDHGDRLADVVHLVVREEVLCLRVRHRRVRDHERERDVVLPEIGVRVDGGDARVRARPRDVEPSDPRVRERAAEERDVERLVRLDVVDEAAHSL